MSWKRGNEAVDWIDFSANCNPYGMPESVRKAYHQAVIECESYPDPLCRELRSAIAQFESLPPEWILPGNGASDLICRIAFALQPKQALLLAPTFAEYKRALTAVGCQIMEFPLRQDNSFQVTPAILDQIPGNDLLVLCNPNNPSGMTISSDLMKQVISVCQHHGTYLLVDECFREFLPSPEQYTVKPYLREFPQLILLNAFTKYFAIPGLRLGYVAVSDGVLLERVERFGAEWSVSTVAQRCGIAAAGEMDYLCTCRVRLAGERERMTRSLQTLGVTVYPSQVNYLLFFTRFPDLQQKLAAQGILIRDCSNYSGLEKGYYRVAVRRPEENDRLIASLRQVFMEVNP